MGLCYDDTATVQASSTQMRLREEGKQLFLGHIAKNYLSV